MKTIISNIRSSLISRKDRSAWGRGVTQYAIELLEDFAEYDHEKDDVCNARLLRKALLKGAYDWHQYSDGGRALIRDQDIAERLCNATELKRTHNGLKEPNARENWLDVQARALYQACELLVELFAVELFPN